MKKAPRAALVAALAALAVVPLITACDATRAAQSPDWCPTVPGHQVECGIEQRPLVADDPQLGSVDVSYALIRRNNLDAPAVGTVAPNPGGPGVPLIAHAAQATQLASALLDDHDLLLIDPRGTGQSSPLDCGADEREFELGTREQQRQVVARCGERLGPRAAGYTSAATADDIDAVRERLGIPRLVLYGISYGTFLMPVYAERHPDHVQSMVLTGAFLPDFDLLNRPNADAVSLALHRICERSGACDGATAVADLRTVARRLAAQPLEIGGANPMLLTEAKLATLIFEVATSNVGADPSAPTPLGSLPAALHAAAAGDDTGLRHFAEHAVGAPPTENIDLYMTVACNDYPTVWSRAATVTERERQYRRALDAAEPSASAFSLAGFNAAVRDGGDACIRWPNITAAHPARPSGALPNVPVLVLSGDLDAITPDAHGEQVAARFADATFLSVPNTGHVPDLEPSGCVTGIVDRFIRTGTTGPTTCVESIPPIAVDPVIR
ncbi:alpha/beta fold hydrolase [Nocardia cyriacigeorgica]|uniref:Alpha/beta hydrolase n=1 Tax=Nocardia cyriacigeorgica TaxID=135487 RepID=A0A5R8NQ59_9NOCA|nr:alpha/beta fold hydrolase [Nocardia cyriacigeorgica]TLF76807.1 alpha/beta hydrolase [Nocardia cyriacigeorgica]